MKTLSLLAAMFLTAALAGPAVGEERASSQGAIVATDSDGHGGNTVHFNGTIEATETVQIFGDPPLFSVLGSGTATTTQLGQFTVLYTFIALLSEEVAIGASNYIAADGIIYTYTTGVSSPTPDPDVVSVHETHTISGGTGRYAGATGSFTLNRLANIVTFETYDGSFHGTIHLRNHH